MVFATEIKEWVKMIKQFFLEGIALSFIMSCQLSQKDSSSSQFNNSVETDSLQGKIATDTFLRPIVAFSADYGSNWKPLNDGLP